MPVSSWINGGSAKCKQLAGIGTMNTHKLEKLKVRILNRKEDQVQNVMLESLQRKGQQTDMILRWLRPIEECGLDECGN